MFDLIPYRLPLERPLHLARGVTLRAREGLLLHDPEGGGWGDAVPLPGFSRESLHDVLDAARAGDWMAAELPSLRFAVSCARTVWPPPGKSIRVNALWQPAAEALPEFLKRIVTWVDPLVKVKTATAADLDAVESLLGARKDLRVRLDANRQWSLEQTLHAFERLPAERLDYVEEPLCDPGLYEALWARAPVPIALDETVPEEIFPYLETFPYMVAVLVKPTLLGAPEDWPRLSAGTRRILSSSFESGVGLWHLARLAEPGEAHGLDTGRVFSSDVVSPRPLPDAAGRMARPAQIRMQVHPVGGL